MSVAVAAQPLDFSAVDEAATDAVVSGEIPGVVVLVGRGDDILLHRAWGFRRLVPEPAAMTRDTIFDIASLTKPVGTTLAVLSLVERGAIKLDAPLGRYLKEFRGAPYAEITIRRILTHSAGFPAYPPNSAVAGGFPGAARALARIPLDYPPGSAFQYSDTGFILLAEVVRRVSGHPLGLRATSFHPPASVRDRIAPTEYANGHFLQGEVNDPRARLLGGVAGNAGMFSTSADLPRSCRMLLQGGTLGGHRFLKPDTLRLMFEPAPGSQGMRTLGWDLNSPFARPMSPFFPMGSIGHTGFTGTALWLDPPSGFYLILLTNRVHPYGGGAARIRDLRARVTAAVGAALFSAPQAPAQAAASSPAADLPTAAVSPALAAPGSLQVGRVRTGLDVVRDQRFALFAGQSIGLVTNQTGLDAEGRRAIDLLATAPGVRLQTIFSPEHGITGEANADVPHSRDPATGRPIWSLYGSTRRPTREMLRDVSLLVFDVQDVGARS